MRRTVKAHVLDWGLQAYQIILGTNALRPLGDRVVAGKGFWKAKTYRWRGKCGSRLPVTLNQWDGGRGGSRSAYRESGSGDTKGGSPTTIVGDDVLAQLKMLDDTTYYVYAALPQELDILDRLYATGSLGGTRWKEVLLRVGTATDVKEQEQIVREYDVGKTYHRGVTEAVKRLRRRHYLSAMPPGGLQSVKPVPVLSQPRVHVVRCIVQSDRRYFLQYLVVGSCSPYRPRFFSIKSVMSDRYSPSPPRFLLLELIVDHVMAPRQPAPLLSRGALLLPFRASRLNRRKFGA
ncbi:hypothetical protein AAG570_012456 [Ranatra chinensis]|uniref:Uncharacterized protein n=1 Tax=Ranatra chinensis TaxID=642074 RepID=A0ABD0YDW4_9HEMI